MLFEDNQIPYDITNRWLKQFYEYFQINKDFIAQSSMLLDYIPGKSITVKNIINDYTRQWVEPIRSIHYITMQLYIYILYTN